MKHPSKILMLLAAGLLAVLFFVPLWTITLEAPQYPGGINLYIWVNQLTGDTDYTLQNINILNHYVGMKYIEPDAIPELVYFPFIIGGMIGLGLLVTFAKSPYWRLSWAVLLLLLGVLGMYDFYLWEYDYGHDLAANAPIKIPGMAYQPPLIGSKMLLNFKATSLPNWGGWAFGLSWVLGVLSYWIERPSVAGKVTSGKMAVPKLAKVLGFFALVLLTACSISPQPINYGSEACHYCKMTIVDARYGAELVTQKGKIYKFDAVECLINFEKDTNDLPSQTKWRLVTSFSEPGQLVPAESCHFLRSKALPSPMGAYLSAFGETASAQKFQKEYGGDLYPWKELVANFNQLPSLAKTN